MSLEWSRKDLMMAWTKLFPEEMRRQSWMWKIPRRQNHQETCAMCTLPEKQPTSNAQLAHEASWIESRHEAQFIYHFRIKYLDSVQETMVNGALSGHQSTHECSKCRGSGKCQMTLGQMISTYLKLRQKRTAWIFNTWDQSLSQPYVCHTSCIGRFP